MKKTLLVLSLCCVVQIANAQLHEILKETDWYVDHVVLDGETYPTPLVNVVGIVDPNIVFDEDIAYAVVDPESDSFFSDVTYDPVENAFVFIMPGITLPGCQQYCDFAQVYFEFLFGDGENVPFTYEIFVTDSGAYFLIIMDEFGNEAHYQDTPILGSDNLELSKTMVYPNPVSNLLFISSERAVVQKIAIFDVTGQLVLEQTGETSQMDVSMLNGGIYFAEITSEEGRTVHKFLKN